LVPAERKSLAWRDDDNREDSHCIQDALDGKVVEWMEK
jgi:hypothetical protein